MVRNYILFDCPFSAKDIPERMEIYTTLLGLINLKNHDFVSKVVNALIRELKDALKANRFDDVKYLVRAIVIFSN